MQQNQCQNPQDCLIKKKLGFLATGDMQEDNFAWKHRYNNKLHPSGKN